MIEEKYIIRMLKADFDLAKTMGYEKFGLYSQDGIEYFEIPYVSKELTVKQDLTTIIRFNDFEKWFPKENIEVPKEFISFNLNEFVKIKLTNKGYQLFTQYYNSDIQDSPQFMKKIEDFKKEANVDGYFEMPCHTFINCFGNVTSWLLHEYYDINIKIAIKQTEK